MPEQIKPQESTENNALVDPLERLDFVDVIKRVLTETKHWAEFDKNPQLNHKFLRERAFISQPYICNVGAYRAGFFKQGFPSAGALYLAISSNRTNERLVVRLWPMDWRELNLLYRSPNNNERLLSIDWREFVIRSFPLDHYSNYESYKFYPELLTAAMSSSPNFIFGRGIKNAYAGWHQHGEYPDYNPERIIKVGELPPIYIPWTIELQWNTLLTYVYPIEPVWFKLNSKWAKVEFDSHNEHSNLMISWPRFRLFDRFGRFEKIDLVTLTDKPDDTPSLFLN